MPLVTSEQQCLEIFGIPNLIRKNNKEWVYLYYFLRKFSTHLDLNVNFKSHINLRTRFDDCFKKLAAQNPPLSFEQNTTMVALKKSLLKIIDEIGYCGYIDEFKLFLGQIKNHATNFLKLTPEEKRYSDDKRVLAPIVMFWEKHEQWQFFLDRLETIPLKAQVISQEVSAQTQQPTMQLTATMPPILLAQTPRAICHLSPSPENKKIACYHFNPGGNDFLSFMGEETMIDIHTTSAHFPPLQLEWSSDENHIAILGEDTEPSSGDIFFMIILVNVTNNTQGMIPLPPNSCQPIMRANQGNIFVCPNNANFYFINFSDCTLIRTGQCSEGIIKHTKTINETLIWIGIQRQRLYCMTYSLHGMGFSEKFELLKGYIPEINKAKQLCTNSDNSLVYYDNEQLSELYQFNIATDERRSYICRKISVWCLLNDNEVLVAHDSLLIRYHFESKRAILCSSGIAFTTLQVLPHQHSPQQCTVYLTTATAVYLLILNTIG